MTARTAPAPAHRFPAHRFSETARSRLSVASRIGAAVIGGYVFSWGFISLGLAAFFAADMEFHDAEHLSSILGFLLFLAVFLWAFSARDLRRVWTVLLGGGAVMAGAASLAQSILLNMH